MQHGFMSRYEYITVAVNFDHHTLALIRAAGALCQRTGKKLCLLHAVDTWAQLPVSRPMGERSTLWDTAQGVEMDVRERAKTRLEDIAVEISPMLKTRSHVFLMEAGRSLAAEAQQIGSCLLLVGLDYERARFFPGAMSTALGLLQTSPVPVLVMDGAQHRELAVERLDVLLADDLRADTEPAVAFAFELAGEPREDGAVPGPGTLTHLHVSGLTPELMQDCLSQAAAATHMQVDELGLSGDLHSHILGGLERRLSERAMPYLEYFEGGGGKYLSRVACGAVEEEVARWTREVAPDVIVFGRHHAYYSRPFYVGRMSFKAMLAPRRPVVVVPDA